MNYQFTKSVGFQLQGENLEKIVSADNHCQNQQETLQEFVEQFDKVLRAFEKLVFYEDEGGEKFVRKSLQIKHPWPKQYAKEDFYGSELNKKKEKIFTVETAGFLNDVFINWLSRNKGIKDEIANAILQPEESQKRKSDLALMIRALFSPDSFFFVRDFLQYAKDKNSDFDFVDLQKRVEKFQVLLEQVSGFLSPNQVTGLEIARASFNFYAVNKTPKKYEGKTIDEVIDAKNRLLNGGCIRKYEAHFQFLKEIGFEKYLEEHSEKYDKKTKIGDLGLSEFYSALKDFKSSQKKGFNEAIYGGVWQNVEIQKTKKKFSGTVDFSKAQKNRRFNSFADLGMQLGLKPQKESAKNGFVTEDFKKQLEQFVCSNFPLFSEPKDKDILWKFVELTEQIQNLGKKKNEAKRIGDFEELSELGEEIGALKKKRGEYFREKWGFEKYAKDFCDNLFRKVAIEIGNLKAEIRGLEQAKIEVRLLHYWAAILESDNKRFLVLIPKDKMREAKSVIEKGKNSVTQMDSNCSIVTFNSITLRALDKLIRKNYSREISQKGDIPFKEDQEKIRCYKDAISGKLSEINLDLSDFKNDLEEVVAKNHNSLEDFRIDFEKTFYVLHRKVVSGALVSDLQKRFNAIMAEITCYDFERGVVGELRDHTKSWEAFWSSGNENRNFPVRLNPEVCIFYRHALEQADVQKQKNRFSKPHFRVAFTVTQNAGEKELKTTFANTKELFERIEKFNEEVVGSFVRKQNKENRLWYFGIDRGNRELATLGIMRWTQETYEATMKNGEVQRFPNPEFPDIEAWEIKDLSATKEIVIDKKGKKRKVCISANPSYFMDNEEMAAYFTKKHVTFIDLTTAKLIKGRIILNGDVKTYINLKKANAKRKLFAVFSKIMPGANVYFEGGAFRIKLKATKKKDHQILCYYLPHQEKILSRDEMQKDLQAYLDALRKDPMFLENSIQQINHLRDAITANMVGIIFFLHEKYPAIINLENLHAKEHIARHFSANNENIARRLEWALYRKFQKKGLVPPNVKQTIFLREKRSGQKKLQHFGIIHFVKTEGTSGRCPVCGIITPMKNREGDKFKDHVYVCRKNENCKFTTKDPRPPFTRIDNSDSVASYNIARESYHPNGFFAVNPQ